MAVTRIGQGEDLVLLHGWGMNRSVFEPLAEALSTDFCCHLIDLPGFGERPHTVPEAKLELWLAALLHDVPEQAYWLGWSLGGLLVQLAAQKYPERVLGQLLVATTPCFPACKESRWRGIQPQVLSQFSEQLQADAQATIEHFLAIQAMGSETVRQDVKQLKGRLFSLPNSHPQALANGLDLLATTDFRKQQAPAAHWLLGKQDALVPVALARWLAKERPHDVVEVIEQASHAPFISHPEQTLQWIRKSVA